MRIFIITEGSKKIGFGHLVRCLSLSQAFEEKKIYPRFIINSNDQSSRVIGDRPCDIYDWRRDKKRLFIQIVNSEIVIIDSLKIDIDLLKQIAGLANIFVYIDDFKRFDHNKGIIIDWTVLADKLKYHVKNRGVQYLLGTKYASLRNEFWDVKQKNIRKEVTTIMITMGGSDIRNLTPRILSLLTRYYPAVVKKIIIGEGFSNIKAIEKTADKKTELIFYADAKLMKKAMLDSDIVISAGGQTLYELARVGVPTIAVKVADNQLYDINGWRRTEFIDYAGDWTDRTLFNKIRLLVNELMEYSARLNRSGIGRKFIDGEGARRIIAKILNFHQQNI